MVKKVKTYKPISKEIIWYAEERVDEIPILNNSMRGKKANLIGSVEEVLFEKFIKENGLTLEKETGEEMYNHDYVIEGKFKIDVKTKDRTVVPKSYYDCSVETQSKQKPDFYYFVSLLRSGDWRDFKEGYMLGAIDYKTLHEKGEIWNKGDTDARNGMRIRRDCISIEISKLIIYDEFIEIIKGGV